VNFAERLKNKIMSGLARLCKAYGTMKINGVEWVWDWVNDEPRIKSELTKEEWMASEKIKWAGVSERLNNPNK
jgi:hypothetical protein